MQTITSNAREIVKYAVARVPSISAEEPLGIAESPEYLFVDRRDGSEPNIGAIPGVIASSRSEVKVHIAPESPVHQPEFNQDGTYIYCCASIGRSALADAAAKEIVLSTPGVVATWKKPGGTLE